MEKDLAVYVLVRNDLPSMNPGKAMAQVHHAGVQLMSKHGKDKLAKEYLDLGIQHEADHFNTTLVLSASLAQIEVVMGFANLFDDVLADSIMDPSYPFRVDTEIAHYLVANPEVQQVSENTFVRHEVTCGWILIDRNNATIRSILDAFPLHA